MNRPEWTLHRMPTAAAPTAVRNTGQPAGASGAVPEDGTSVGSRR